MPSWQGRSPPRGPQLEIASELGVAFVNTAGAGKRNRQQGIASYADLVTWSRQVGTLSAFEAESLRRRAAERPEEAGPVFARAARIRSALFRLFVGLMTGEALPAADLDVVNAALQDAMPALRLAPNGEGLGWGWEGDEDAFDRPLWPVLHLAAEVLVGAGGSYDVRQCAHKGCTLFFLDRTPSRQRMYCSKSCDNRAQSLRYYYRHGKEKREKDHNWRVKRPRKTT